MYNKFNVNFIYYIVTLYIIYIMYYMCFICLYYILLMSLNLRLLNNLLRTTGHKYIGILYGYLGYIGGVIGYFFSMLMRMELNNQGLSIMRKVKEVTIYNNWITVHGLVMIFVFIMPVSFGFYGNYLIPMMIGTSELSMPRMNGISFWLLVMGVIIFVVSNVIINKPISSGWTIYPPLSTRDADNIGINIDMSLLVVHILGLSSSLGSINFITTNKYNRHVGLIMLGINIYNFAVIVTAVLLIGSLPILGVAVTGLLLDRNINTNIFDNIGDPVLYQHLFWFFGQCGPNYLYIIYNLFNIFIIMHHAICWKALEYITIIISGLLYIFNHNEYKYLLCIYIILIMLFNSHNSDNILFLKSQSAGNQQLHNSIFIIILMNMIIMIVSLVGTSETTRMKSSNNTNNKLINNNNSHNKYNEWLAGLIDGDGCFIVSNKGYTSLEITMELSDKSALCSIKDKYGGSIKLRSGANAWRYRLHHKEGMIKLVNDVNGNIRNSKRLPQFHRVCQILNIPVISPIILNNKNYWFTGFFDADGTITYSIKDNKPQLSIRVSNKYIQDVQYFKDVFGGNIYFDNSANGSYQWSIQSRSDILSFYQYLRLNPSRSHKLNRIHLINKYYELVDLNAYNLDHHSYRAWELFNNKWFNKHNQ